MATIQEMQQFLRQKRAGGRLMPNEIQQAYRGYFDAEAGRSLDRTRMELDQKRQAAAERQADTRIAQNERQVQMAERAEEAAADAAKVKGRLQLAQLAVPSLFDAGSGGGMGAQGDTEGAISGGGPAIGGLDSSGDAFDSNDSFSGKSSSIGAHNAMGAIGDSFSKAGKAAALGGLVGGGQGALGAGALSLGKDAISGLFGALKGFFGSLFGDEKDDDDAFGYTERSWDSMGNNYGWGTDIDADPDFGGDGPAVDGPTGGTSPGGMDSDSGMEGIA